MQYSLIRRKSLTGATLERSQMRQCLGGRSGQTLILSRYQAMLPSCFLCWCLRPLQSSGQVSSRMGVRMLALNEQFFFITCVRQT